MAYLPDIEGSQKIMKNANNIGKGRLNLKWMSCKNL